MTFFVDANVIVYATSDGPYADACRSILTAVAGAEADGVTSTAALEEVWHLELSGRLGAVAGLTRDAYTIFHPLLPVGDQTFGQALSVDAEGLGANDRIHVATCLEHGIDTIVTADAGFEDVRGLRRVDPLDARAVSRLLRS